jgi:hypothetical protein
MSVSFVHTRCTERCVMLLQLQSTGMLQLEDKSEFVEQSS